MTEYNWERSGVWKPKVKGEELRGIVVFVNAEHESNYKDEETGKAKVEPEFQVRTEGDNPELRTVYCATRALRDAFTIQEPKVGDRVAVGFGGTVDDSDDPKAKKLFDIVILERGGVFTTADADLIFDS